MNSSNEDTRHDTISDDDLTQQLTQSLSILCGHNPLAFGEPGHLNTAVK